MLCEVCSNKSTPCLSLMPQNGPLLNQHMLIGGHNWEHDIPASIYTLLVRMDHSNTLTHSFTQITLTLRFPCHPSAACEWCHLVSCRCSQPWCSSRGRPERSASLYRHQQTHPEGESRRDECFFSWMNGSYGSHICCGTGMFCRAVTTSTLTASNISYCERNKIIKRISKLFLFLSLPCWFCWGTSSN